MRTWSRVSWDCHCGLCNSLLRRGDPVLRIQIPGMRRALLRCPLCVGPAPPDLPALVARTEPQPVTMHPLRELAATVAQDFKAKAAGE
jgi:hypothetical protein